MENEIKFIGEKKIKILYSPNKNYRNKSYRINIQNRKTAFNAKLKRKEKNYPQLQVNIDHVF